MRAREGNAFSMAVVYALLVIAVVVLLRVTFGTFRFRR